VTRPNFSVGIPGSTQGFTTKNGVPWITYGPKTVADARFASETIVGSSRRKPKGWIAPTSYSLVRREWRKPNGSISIDELILGVKHHTERSGYVGDSDQLSSLNDWDAIVTEAVAQGNLSSNTALIKARLKLKSKSVDLGVAFAERKQTSRMLGDTARSLALAVRDLRHGEFRNAARRLGILSNPGKPRGSNWTNHWLQLQYGWKPLLSDVYGACSALSKRDRSDWRVTAKASDRDVSNWSVSNTTRAPWTGSAVRNRGVFVRLDAIPGNDLTMSLSSLGVTNPLLVAWELVPYSFVVDWFLPVGNWLDSLDALLGYTSAYQSISFWNECSWEYHGNSIPKGAAQFTQSWQGTKRRLGVSRSAASGVSIPTFPRIKDPRSLGHMANGLSLLSQAFGR